MEQMQMTNGDGILLIRNPYKAIYGHRHLDAGGHVGFADASHFFGSGIGALLNHNEYLKFTHLIFTQSLIFMKIYCMPMY